MFISISIANAGRTVHLLNRQRIQFISVLALQAINTITAEIVGVWLNALMKSERSARLRLLKCGIVLVRFAIDSRITKSL